MAIKAIIFDMDGTLLDSEVLWTQVPFDLFAHFGAPEDRSNAPWASTSFSETLRGYLAQPDHRLQMTYDEMRAWCTEHMFSQVYPAGIPLKEGARETLDVARAHHVPMCLISATRLDALEAALHLTNLLEYFEFYASTRGAALNKKNPELFYQTAARLGCTVQECLVVEDSLHAMRTAREAGCTVWAMYDDKHVHEQEEILRTAHRFFKTHAQLQSALDELLG